MVCLNDEAIDSWSEFLAELVTIKVIISHLLPENEENN